MVTDRPNRLPPDHRIYVVGDVHGHDDTLHALHDQVARDLRRHPVARPLLVHLGDYIDRGPGSAAVLQRLAGGPALPGVDSVQLMGNHERMMLDALARRTPGALPLWLANGGAATLRSWGIPRGTPPERWAEAIPPAHLQFLRTLPLYHRDGGYLFVHAGVRPGIRLASQTEDDLLWIREGFLDWDGTMLPDDPDLLIVHGHTPTPAPAIFPNRLGLDTGCGKGGPLTCAVLDGHRLRFLEA